MLKISFDLKEDYLVVNILDNGIGRVATKAKQTDSKKISSLASIQRRIDLLNDLERKKEKPIKLIIDDLYHDNGKAKGTLIILKFPV